ncbi:unnamed protein product [Prorocentrum cordatum]|uniref:Uncharacterized protein n=1 Tax=Prorocentrum cordatum TaxID=2364126 RepID=A0ABN9T6D1_9DINO|nr:unnamed protein product [Polarella glacialis]
MPPLRSSADVRAVVAAAGDARGKKESVNLNLRYLRYGQRLGIKGGLSQVWCGQAGWDEAQLKLRTVEHNEHQKQLAAAQTSTTGDMSEVFNGGVTPRGMLRQSAGRVSVSAADVDDFVLMCCGRPAPAATDAIGVPMFLFQLARSGEGVSWRRGVGEDAEVALWAIADTAHSWSMAEEPRGDQRRPMDCVLTSWSGFAALAAHSRKQLCAGRAGGEPVSREPSTPHVPLQGAAPEPGSPRGGRRLAEEQLRRQRAEAQAAALQAQLDEERAERRLLEQRGHAWCAASEDRLALRARVAELEAELARKSGELDAVHSSQRRVVPSLHGDLSERIAMERAVCDLQDQLVREISMRTELQSMAFHRRPPSCSTESPGSWASSCRLLSDPRRRPPAARRSASRGGSLPRLRRRRLPSDSASRGATSRGGDGRKERARARARARAQRHTEPLQSEGCSAGASAPRAASAPASDAVCSDFPGTAAAGACHTPVQDAAWPPPRAAQQAGVVRLGKWHGLLEISTRVFTNMRSAWPLKSFAVVELRPGAASAALPEILRSLPGSCRAVRLSRLGLGKMPAYLETMDALCARRPEAVDLSGNGLGDACVTALEQLLSSSGAAAELAAGADQEEQGGGALRSLNLSGNAAISAAGLAQLLAAPRALALERLDLSECALGAASAQLLVPEALVR